jgi:hypothetical protein
MTFKTLDTIVLDKELPDHDLRPGDLGVVVEIYPPDGLEVECVTGSGRTKALVTLKESDVRTIADTDLVAVRSTRGRQ